MFVIISGIDTQGRIQMKNNFLVIFDLDGVLIESREVHYDSLNIALSRVDPKYVISQEEHLSKYDGLGTTTKLRMLSEEKVSQRLFINRSGRTSKRLLSRYFLIFLKTMLL